MTIPSTIIKFTMPTGLALSAEIPACHEADIIELGLRAFMGALTALAQADGDADRRIHLLNFVGSVLTSSENTVKRVIFANETSTLESSHVIDDLLRSLNKPEAPNDG